MKQPRNASCLSPVESTVEGSIAAEVEPISEKGTFGGLDFAVNSGKQAITKITVLSGEKKHKLTAFSIAEATEEAEAEIEFGGEVEVV
jgi:hypothetical protein